jgi:small GTP-binding protein
MAKESSSDIDLKCVVVGHHGAGKTCAIITLTTDFELNWGPHLWIPTLMHDFYKYGDLNGISCRMNFWDTMGQEEFSQLRTIAYPGTHAFLLFIDVSDSRTTLEEVPSFWLPEIRLSCPNVPIILVGSKIDLRGTNGINTISFEDGQSLAEKIGAAKYMEISSLENRGLVELFDEALRIGCRYKASDEEKSGQKKSPCHIL